ncbi:MAG: hypothetical protein IJT44_09950 [Clostridia bacterium]|nr:hypothetical protein [Clostridia bacterium]
MKRFLSIILCALTVFGAVSFGASAEDGALQTGSLKLINYNVDGLPIPAFATSENRDPLSCSRQIPATLNACNADVIAVQEDFNFHAIHKKNIDMPYKTIHSGVIPFGDGLNFFSKFPMYNIAREPWKDANGILSDGADTLTPKGFLCASMEIADGVYIDVYDIHADADDTEPDIAARISQYTQLLDFIDAYSKDHAVIIIGDTNARFLQTENRLKEMFIDGAGFKEVWIEMENGGRYTLTPEDEARFNAEYDSWWGYWDSAEKIFYRDGGGVSFEAKSHEYVWFLTEEGERLADHAAELATLDYTIDRSAVHDTRTYKKESIDLVRTIVLHVNYFFKSLFLILSDLPRLLVEKIRKG